MYNRSSTQRGFTIVELLIVIVVIAILASISIVAYAGIQDRARQSKVRSDISNIAKAISIARENNSKSLGQITGAWNTGGACWGKPAGTDLAALPTTDNCWINYNAFLNVVSNESGVDIRGLTDPWGRPYMIDENEGESVAYLCVRDTVAVYGQPFAGNTVHSWTPRTNIPLSRYAGCTT